MNTKDQSLEAKASSCIPHKVKSILLKERRNFQTWLKGKKDVKNHMKKDEKEGERIEDMKKDEGLET
jgi:hypothetical protein